MTQDASEQVEWLATRLFQKPTIPSWKNSRVLIVAFMTSIACPTFLIAQQPPEKPPRESMTPATTQLAKPSGLAPETETIVVTGTFESVPLSEANRSVVVLDTAKHPLLSNSVIDHLEIDSSIDLQQRGPDGVQADLSVRGSTFEQSLVLVNGFRINDAQSGHHDLDIPFPLESLSRVEVLHGSGSTLYGADALSGAVNFITARPEQTEFRARAGVGSFGFNQQHAVFSYLNRGVSELLAGSRDFSTGFQPDRDYRSSSASSETRFGTGWGETDLLMAGSDRPFGADQFYGNFPSWERTKSWLASISQSVGDNTNLAFGYRRHSDEFVLVRNDPSIYENNHVSQSWQAAVHRTDTWRRSIIAYGVDADGDQIDSNNLGHHARNREAGYVNVDLQPVRSLFLSIGGREEIFTRGLTEFAPTVAGAVFLRKGLKLRASASRGFRLPTYTDLYYSDPANIGDPFLKPESAWDFEGGLVWNSRGRVSLETTVFDRRESNDIDYVRSSPTAPWQATNISRIVFLGTETQLDVRLPHAQQVDLGYTVLSSDQHLPSGITSKYVFNYPTHNAYAAWQGNLGGQVVARTRVGVTQRVGQSAYAVWDLAASRSEGRIRPYLQLSNLSNTGYEEIPGVSMPGRSIIGGFEFLIFTRDRH